MHCIALSYMLLICDTEINQSVIQFHDKIRTLSSDGVLEGLRFVIVALPGLFSYFFSPKYLLS